MALNALRGWNKVTSTLLLDMDGIERLREIKTKHAHVKVIILTQYADMKFYRTMMSMGANGYLLKSTTENQFIQDFNAVVFDNATVSGQGFMDEVQKKSSELKSTLDARKIEVLGLVCREMSSHEIASKLNISFHTVNNHRKSIMKKTGQLTLAGLANWAREHNVV